MNSWIEEIIRIVDKATPLNTTIKPYYDYALSQDYKVFSDGITIEINKINESKYLRVSLYKVDNKLNLVIRVSTGAEMTLAINEREYAMLNLSIVNCISRFNDNVITFFQNF